MALVQVKYTGNGATTNYSLPFNYINKAHVKARVNGALTTAFTWANATTIQFNSAPANGAAIVLFRQTPSDNVLADFSPGAAIREVDLEANFTQFLYVLQETQGGGITNTEYPDVSLDSLSQLIFIRVANVAAIPASPATGDLIEVVDTTGLESFTPLTGIPSGFVGSSNLSTRLARGVSSWAWVDYKANDPDARYLATTGVSQIIAGSGIAVSPGSGRGQVTVSTSSGGSGGGAQADLNAVSNPLTPVGLIVWLQRPEIDPPTGWLYCNGIDKSRNQYNLLFNIIGTTYGVGDGSTTFGFPLEANLTPPPYAVDSTWNPFIKFGSRTSEPGEIYCFVNNSNQITAGTITTAAYTAYTVDNNTLPLNSPSMSADGTVMTCGKNITSGRNVFVWKRSGTTYNAVTCTPDNIGTIAVTHAAVSPDGVYAAFVSNSDLTSCWIYKANSTFTTYTLLTTLTFSALGTAHASLQWNEAGNYLTLCGTGASTTPARVFSRSGDTFTAISLATIASLTPNGAAMNPDGSILLVTADAIYRVLVRVGSSFIFFQNLATTGFVDAPPIWNKTGTILYGGGAAWRVSGQIFTSLTWSSGNQGYGYGQFLRSNPETLIVWDASAGAGAAQLFYYATVGAIGITGTVSPTGNSGRFQSAGGPGNGSVGVSVD